MNHGSKQPNGCIKGKSCSSFHPKMCPGSMAKGACYDKDCQLTHVRGTKRERMESRKPKSNEDKRECKESRNSKSNEDKTTTCHTKQGTSPNAPPDSDSFLENHRLTIEELVEAVDTKIATAMSTIPQAQAMPAQQPNQQPMGHYNLSPWYMPPPLFPPMYNQFQWNQMQRMAYPHHPMPFYSNLR